MNGQLSLKATAAMVGIGIFMSLCLNTLAGQNPPGAPRSPNDRRVFLTQLSESVNKVVVNHEEQVRSSRGIIDRLRLLESRLDRIRRAANGYRRRSTTVEQLLATIESNTNESGKGSEEAIARLLSVQEAFELISQIMKARHETAKNIIQNIRG